MASKAMALTLIGGVTAVTTTDAVEEQPVRGVGAKREIADAVGFDLRAPASRRIFGGVVEQIGDHLREPDGIQRTFATALLAPELQILAVAIAQGGDDVMSKVEGGNPGLGSAITFAMLMGGVSIAFAAVLPREDVRDVLVGAESIASLPRGASARWSRTAPAVE